MYLISIAVEIFAGLKVHSIALLAMAGLNLLTFSVLISEIFSFRLLNNLNGDLTKNIYKCIILLIILLNLLVFGFTLASTLYKSIHHEFEADTNLPIVVIWISLFGIIVNEITFRYFKKESFQNKSMEVACLKVKANTFYFIALILFSLAIYFLQWYDIDLAFGSITLTIIFFHFINLIQRKLNLN